MKDKEVNMEALLNKYKSYPIGSLGPLVAIAADYLIPIALRFSH